MPTQVTVISKKQGLLVVSCGGFTFRVKKETMRRGSRWNVKLDDGDSDPYSIGRGDSSCPAWSWFSSLHQGFYRDTMEAALLALADFMSKAPSVLELGIEPMTVLSKWRELVEEVMPIVHCRRTKRGRSFNADLKLSGHPRLFQICVDQRVHWQLRWRQRSTTGLWRVVCYTSSESRARLWDPEFKREAWSRVSCSDWQRAYPDLLDIDQGATKDLAA